MKKLSIIMPFLKEGIEPVKTVLSINNTIDSRDVEILVICDEPEYEYEELLIGFKNVRLIKNTHTIGIDSSRSVGINQATAPACLIIDGHMRFLNDDWVTRICDAIKNEPTTLWCTKSLVLTDEMNDEELNPLQDFKVRNLHYSTGATFHISEKNNLPLGLKWLNGDELKNSNKNYEIPCVLGANYAGSTKWLKKTRAFEGLLGYGYSEQYVSLKNWILGGKCKGLDTVGIAHIFRKTRPYSVDYSANLYNALFTAYTLFPDEVDFFNFYVKFIKYKAGSNSPEYRRATQMILDRWDIVSTYREYFLSYKKIKVVDFLQYFNIQYNMEGFGDET
jgi:glycosyltransferase involved in cell wall biosynthesis